MESLLEGRIRKHLACKTTSEDSSLTTSIDFKKEIKSAARLEASKRFQNTLWSITSPINKLT